MIENARIEIFQTGSMVINPKFITETIIIPDEPNFPDLNPTRYVHYLQEQPIIDTDHPFVISGFERTMNAPGEDEYKLSYDFDPFTKDGVEFNAVNIGEEITIQYWGMGGNPRKENLFKEMFLASREILNISLDGVNPPKIDADFICQVVTKNFIVNNIIANEEITFSWNSDLFPVKENNSIYYLFVNIRGQFGSYKDNGSNAPLFINRRFGWYDLNDRRVVARFEVLNDGSVGYIIKYFNEQIKPGIISMYGGVSLPAGWLLCDGAAISRSSYPGLFSIISTSFGVGDGSTTFNLPDFRGVYPKGAGITNRSTGKDANGNFYSGTLGQYNNDKMQGHKHTMTTGSGGGSGLLYEGASSWHNLSTSNPVSDGSNGTPRTGSTTEPQNLGVNFIIKY